MAHNIDKTDAVRLTIEIVGDKENTTTNPNWVAADPDKNPTHFYFQLKDGERLSDANVLLLDGKRLSLISGDGRFGIDKATGLITRLIDTPQYEEQTLEVVVTDTALVSAAVSVVIEKNHAPTLSSDLNPDGPVTLILGVNGDNDGQTTNPEWVPGDSDNNPTHYYFQLNEGERFDDANVIVIDGKRLSLTSADGRFNIDQETGLITRNDPTEANNPQLVEQTLLVVVTDTELVSEAVSVVIDKNHDPMLERILGEDEDAKITFDVNAAPDQGTAELNWDNTDQDGHNTFFYFELGENDRLDDLSVQTIDGRRLSQTSADGRYHINAETGQITATGIDQENPALFCVDDTVSIVVTDTEMVSAAVTVTIDRTIPTLDSSNMDSDYSVNSIKSGFDIYLDFSLTTSIDKSSITIDEYRTIGAKSVDEAETPIRQIDKLNLDMGITEFTKLDFHREVLAVTPTESDLRTEVNNLHVVMDSDMEGKLEVTVVDQYAGTDTKVEYVQFGQDMSFAGYILNDGQNNESGYYHLTTDRDTETGDLTATVCRDLLASDDGAGEVLNGLEDNDLIFSNGLGDTLIGGEGSDLLFIGEHASYGDSDVHPVVATVVLGDVDAFGAPDQFDTVVNFDKDSVIQLDGFTITFEEDAVSSLIDKIDVADLLAYLETPPADNTYLITTDGCNSDIWYFNEGVQDQVAHFVNFDFTDYKVTAVLPV
ncbi:MAG: hypothetical protein CFE38_13920 [Comamonadaceae bacterium PBBC1]|nr:MAG: hypothetical protein CFE38_13920 [Comamonadaceae bacterium PBBC1]